MSKLKACPFCGGEAEKISGERTMYPHIIVWSIGCKKDCVVTNEFMQLKKAIKTWNTRSVDVVEIEKILKHLIAETMVIEKFWKKERIKMCHEEDLEEAMTAIMKKLGGDNDK